MTWGRLIDMEPVSLVLAALVAGATAGITVTAATVLGELNNNAGVQVGGRNQQTININPR
jgi:hypothetical protein